MLERAWGMSAVLFGTWEAVAYSTRRVPTVSETVWRLGGCRHRRVVQAGVVLYVAGLGRHLLAGSPRR